MSYRESRRMQWVGMGEKVGVFLLFFLHWIKHQTFFEATTMAMNEYLMFKKLNHV